MEAPIPPSGRADRGSRQRAADAGRFEFLLLDDDVRWLDLAGRVIVADGDGLRRCTDVEEALAWARRATPDLFVCDLELPGRDGFSVVRELRADPQLALMPVLVLSGHADAATRTAAFAAGADCFLSKSAPAEELAAAARALALHGRQLRDLEPSEAVLISLARMVDLHGLETMGHLERCGRLARDFGTALGLPTADLRALERAGWLHDVGKIGIAREVLNKPGPLTPEERRIVEQHPLIGVRICEPLVSLRPVLPIIRHHHERWDGGGYPDRLAGERIPFLARVFQVADIFDALTSRRCYKDALPISVALRMLRDEALREWRDPLLVECFARAVEEGQVGTL